MFKQRLYELFLLASTEYAELLLGFLSLSMGIWLLVPKTHSVFQPIIINHFGPEVAGLVLTMSGMLKLVGLYRQNFTDRKISCFLASVMWLFLTIAFMQNNVTKFSIVAIPLTIVMSLFNSLIFIKLKVVTK